MALWLTVPAPAAGASASAKTRDGAAQGNGKQDAQRSFNIWPFNSNQQGDPQLARGNISDFMNRVSVAFPIEKAETLDLILAGKMDACVKSAVENDDGLRELSELTQNSGRPFGLGISLHFSKAHRLFYEVVARKGYHGWDPVNRVEMKALARWGKFLDFIRDVGEGMRKKGAVFGRVCEYHLPPYEAMSKGRTTEMNPCSLDCHANMLWRFMRTVAEFNHHRIPHTSIVITEHVGSIARDGKVLDALERQAGAVPRTPEAEARIMEYDALLNQLIYNIYLGELDADLRKARGKNEYRHAFEVMPEDNVSSRNLSKPYHLIVTGSAYGGIVPDVAHVMQNRHLREFKGVDPKEFQAYVERLLERLDIRHTEISEHLERMNRMMETEGFGKVYLGIDRVNAHLERLKTFGYHYKPKQGEAEEGLGALFYWLRKAKEWRDLKKKAKERLDRPLLSVIHVVSPALDAEGTPVTDISAIATGEEVMAVFRGDNRYVRGKHAQADRIMDAIMKEAKRTLGKYDYAGLCFVNEAKPLDGMVETWIGESLELNRQIFDMYRAL